VVGLESWFKYGPLMDMDAMIAAGVHQLIGAGRSRIGLIGGDTPQMAATFKKELLAHGAAPVAEWIASIPGNQSIAGLGWRQFQQIWSARVDKPDGLLVLDDIMFRDAAMAILAVSIEVPRQLMVVTHSNKGSNIHYPFPVVRLENDPDTVAAAMADMLAALLRKEPVKEKSRDDPLSDRGTRGRDVDGDEGSRHADCRAFGLMT